MSHSPPVQPYPFPCRAEINLLGVVSFSLMLNEEALSEGAMKNKHAVAMGRKGGSVTSAAKSRAAKQRLVALGMKHFLRRVSAMIPTLLDNPLFSADLERLRTLLNQHHDVMVKVEAALKAAGLPITDISRLARQLKNRNRRARLGTTI
jgi:hypothetical protein